jgi:hypothetical protein
LIDGDFKTIVSAAILEFGLVVSAFESWVGTDMVEVVRRSREGDIVSNDGTARAKEFELLDELYVAEIEFFPMIYEQEVDLFVACGLLELLKDVSRISNEDLALVFQPGEFDDLSRHLGKLWVDFDGIKFGSFGQFATNTHCRVTTIASKLYRNLIARNEPMHAAEHSK